MNYISVKDAATKWNVSIRQVQHLCLENKISGAVSLGKQWLIPENTERPADGRTKNAKLDRNTEAYHFPILVHSRYYSTTVGLNAEEKQLLKGQIYNVAGKYKESIDICRNAILQTSDRHTKFGGFITLAYNYMLLGDYDKLKSCIIKLNSLLENEIVHKEDFFLIYNGLMLHLGLNKSALLNIDQQKISADGIIYFQSIIIENSFVNNEKVSISILKLYETLSRDLVAHGIIPTLLMSHCLLASLYYRNKKYDLCDYHTIEAYKIAKEHDLLNYLSKYYLAIKKPIDKIIIKDDKKILDEIKRLNKENLNNWGQMSKKELGKISKFIKFTN